MGNQYLSAVHVKNPGGMSVFGYVGLAQHFKMETLRVVLAKHPDLYLVFLERLKGDKKSDVKVSFNDALHLMMTHPMLKKPCLTAQAMNACLKMNTQHGQ
jgi:hypothetical protein